MVSQSLVDGLILVVGVVLSGGLITVTRLVPLERRCGELEIERAALGRELAGVRGVHEHVVAQLAEVKEQRDQELSLRSTAEQRVAALEATITQVRAAESEVEARFRETAQHFVDRAQKTLVELAVARVAADASVLQTKLVAVAGPLGEQLGTLTKAIKVIDEQRKADRERFVTTLENFGQKIDRLDAATERVAAVLTSSTARGSWGEYELRRLIEYTGMTEHVSFEVQESGYGDELRGRPDVVLKLPGDLTVPIDAKVPFSSYQQAVAASSVDERTKYLDEALIAVRGHIRALAARRYHTTPGCVGWTVMFVPIEAMLSALFAHDPDLLDGAREARILIASPLTLLLYLEAFARGWSVQRQSENAEKILTEARELIVRLGRFTEHFAKVGKHLESGLDSYNEAVGSYESRLGPQAQRIIELGVSVDGKTALTVPPRRANVRGLNDSRIPLLAAEALEVAEEPASEDAPEEGGAP